ncbi:spermatogenesis-associated protein 6-like isoform X3 [Ptychodera flava]|uniref:spermatogenesis-associated protein 6-like isoform X3 n=1 Tax=Ptychodera flava TaxID=63121 RepID=UPI00396A7A71
MPRKALRAVVELNIEAVTCPGTFLREREDVYLSVCLLGCQKKTIAVPPVFPLLIHQVLRFERTFANCIDPAQLSLELEGEHVYIELIQLKPDYEGGTVLAYYESSSREFLYPDPFLSPSYTLADREILLHRTLAFRGISPKLEFSCSTTVKDTCTPTLDELRDLALANSDEEIITYSPKRKSRLRKKRSKSYEVPTISSRVKSPNLKRRQLFDESMRQQTLDERPPFVVRRVDTFNRQESPAKGQSPSPRRPQSAPLLRSRSVSPHRRYLRYISAKDCTICSLYRRYLGDKYWGHRYNFHPHHGLRVKPIKAVREPEVSLSSSTTDLSDDTEELIEGLNHLEFSDTSESDYHAAEPLPSDWVAYGRLPSYTPRSSYSPRPTSPVLARSSIRDRYGDSPFTSTKADRIHDRVEHLLWRNRPLYPY